MKTTMTELYNEVRGKNYGSKTGDREMDKMIFANEMLSCAEKRGMTVNAEEVLNYLNGMADPMAQASKDMKIVREAM